MKTPPGLLLIALATAVSCQSAQTDGTVAGTPAPAPVPSAAATAEVGDPILPEGPSTLDGVYTAAQADRGRLVFDNLCSNCHEVEDWIDPPFLARWNGESVYRFWSYIYSNMPEGEPPFSLPREQVTDALTFILQLNGLPTGDSELGSDDDSIDDHWLIWGSAPR